MFMSLRLICIGVWHKRFLFFLCASVTSYGNGEKVEDNQQQQSLLLEAKTETIHLVVVSFFGNIESGIKSFIQINSALINNFFSHRFQIANGVENPLARLNSHFTVVAILFLVAAREIHRRIFIVQCGFSYCNTFEWM